MPRSSPRDMPHKVPVTAVTVQQSLDVQYHPTFKVVAEPRQWIFALDLNPDVLSLYPYLCLHSVGGSNTVCWCHMSKRRQPEATLKMSSLVWIFHDDWVLDMLTEILHSAPYSKVGSKQGPESTRNQSLCANDPSRSWVAGMLGYSFKPWWEPSQEHRHGVFR